VRSAAEYEKVLALIRVGKNDCEIARLTGVPRPTVSGWRRIGRRGALDGGCPVCDNANLEKAQYAYLLGLYLGDGCLSQHPRRVYRLRIGLDARYPKIISACAAAIIVVRGRAPVGRIERTGCVEVNAWWKHWVCLFPQHGLGRKHKRSIELQPWQQRVAAEHPGRLLRGLIHSDGCRVLNRVNGTDYVRYLFSNKSDDIRRIFCVACADLGLSWTHPRWDTISIARRRDTALLDEVIGPKT
jgi:hypothetical protein